jgi:HSP20 family protein
MLMRTDPFRDFDRLARTWFEPTEAGRAMPMPYDAYRNGDVVVLQMDLPGIDPTTIELTVERNELRVEAERRRDSVEGRQYLVQERPMGRATRRMFLGENLDTDHLDAEYDHGVLTLRIPLRESAKPRRVSVRSTPESASIPAPGA